MSKVMNSEELKSRLQQASGESILACGWGTLGMKNVFVGITPTALCLEFISFTMNTREIRRIPFEELEFVYSIAGEATTPKMLKMNLQAQINEALTGTLVLKTVQGKLTYLTFRKMPRYESNNRTPFRIAEYLSSIRSELVHLPDLSKASEPTSKSGCFRRFLFITLVLAIVLTALLGLLLDEGWKMAGITGLATAVMLGAVFAPLVPIFKRMLTGEA